MMTRNYYRFLVVGIVSVMIPISFFLLSSFQMMRVLELGYARPILFFSLVTAIFSALVVGYRTGLGKPIPQQMLRKNLIFRQSHGFRFLGKWIVIAQEVDVRCQGSGNENCFCALDDRPDNEYLHTRKQGKRLFFVGFRKLD